MSTHSFSGNGFLSGVLVSCSVLLAVLMIEPGIYRAVRGQASPEWAPGIDPALPTWSRLIQGQQAVGPETAPNTVVVFTDHGCAYCRAYSSILQEVRDSLGDSVRTVIRTYPLRLLGGGSVGPALAGYCAARQGGFREVDSILALAPDPSDWQLLGSAARLPDPVQFASCIQNRETVALVSEDLRIGRLLGIKSLPLVLVNEERFGSAPGATTILQRIRGRTRRPESADGP